MLHYQYTPTLRLSTVHRCLTLQCPKILAKLCMFRVYVSDAGIIYLEYNSPGGYLAHVPLSKFAFFHLTAHGGLPENLV